MKKFYVCLILLFIFSLRIAAFSQPEITITTPDGTDWGDQVFGTYPANKRINIKNDGSANLSLTSISILSGGSPDITIDVNPAPTTIIPGNSVNAYINYAPTIAGSQSATIRINSNDTDENPTDIVFTGNGKELSVKPNPVNFEFVKVSQSATKILSIVNDTTLDTTYTLNINNPDGVFSPVGTDTVQVNGGTTQTLQIKYEPSAVVSNSSFFSLLSSNPSLPNIYGLIEGRGWSKTHGKKIMVNSLPSTITVENDGTYTNTQLYIPAGAFSLPRTITIQEPDNNYGRPNAIEVIGIISMTGNATLTIEYQDSDLLLDINSGEIPLFWNYEKIAKYNAGNWDTVPSSAPIDLGGGKYKVSADINSFSSFATKNTKTSVNDWNIQNK